MILIKVKIYLPVIRRVTTMASEIIRKGLVLGFYEGEKTGEFTLTKVASNFNEKNTSGKLSELIQISGLSEKKGKTRLFCGLDSQFNNVVVTSLGKKSQGFNELEEIDEAKESVRSAVASGVRILQDSGIRSISVDPCFDAEAAAEGAYLSTNFYEELKSVDKRKGPVDLEIASDGSIVDDDMKSSWEKGKIKAEGQNLARYLMESPANKMTPTRFAEIAIQRLANLENVKVTVRDKLWVEIMKMGAFLSVAQGSDEPLKFVEIDYKGSADPPIAFVGKGITFDSGGISIKSSANMDEMRADMGGAACVLGSIYTAAKLKLPKHVMGFIPLTENMPSGKATKPGDVHFAMNGKSIQIDNTDAEGRLVLSDALCYAQTFKPCSIVDMATLTGAIMIALGGSAAAAFTNSKSLWEQMHQAGVYTGDRVWRMPLFKFYTKQVTESVLADVNNIGSVRFGGSCTAAAFLREFVTNDHWMHLDIAGVMNNANHVPYLPKGMSGRPTRTLVEFLANFKMP